MSSPNSARISSISTSVSSTTSWSSAAAIVCSSRCSSAQDLRDAERVVDELLAGAPLLSLVVLRCEGERRCDELGVDVRLVGGRRRRSARRGDSDAGQRPRRRPSMKCTGRDLAHLPGGRTAGPNPEPGRMLLRRRHRKAAQLARMLIQLERNAARPPRGGGARRISLRKSRASGQLLPASPARLPRAAPEASRTRAGSATPSRPARGRARRRPRAPAPSRLSSPARHSAGQLGAQLVVARVGLADVAGRRAAARPCRSSGSPRGGRRRRTARPAQRVGLRAEAEGDRAAGRDALVADAEAEVLAVADRGRLLRSRSRARAA